MKRALGVVLIAGIVLIGLADIAYAPYHNPPPAPPSTPSATSNVKQQLATAITHSGFAAEGSTLSYAHEHLGHAVNCLEGTRGKNFNAAWGHVCEGEGSGILVDLKAASGGATYIPVAEAASALGLVGVKSKDLQQAKVAAKGVQALLKVINDTLK